jgi:hypothetical protein
MSDTQPSPTNPARAIDQLERDVIYLLTDRPEGQRHWSVQEVGNEIESQGAAADALHALARAGLIHLDSDGFVFATRPAIRFRELIGEASV